MFSARNLSFAYDGGAQILNQFSMDVNADEIVSLLGPSGCGKSTVLRLVADLLVPKKGEIEWSEPQELAFVFQDHALMPWATVKKNASLPGRLRGQVDEKAVLAALEAVGLGGLENRYPSELSGGQRMRASVARAIAASPTLLLMDEPFAALDEILRFQMNELLLSLKTHRGFSAIFVTHSLYEAAYLSDRVFVMRDGLISGTVEPGLNRALTAEQQRTSPEYLTAIQSISTLMEEGRA